MDLVIDIGNHRIKGALFQRDTLERSFSLSPENFSLKGFVDPASVKALLVASVDKSKEERVRSELASLGLPFHLLDFATVKVSLLVDEPEQLGHDRIANVYGALSFFPQNDCIVVDIGTAITVDYIGCDGSYRGGAILPGPYLSALALAEYTSALPKISPAIPSHAIAKTTKGHIEAGLYWGLLGAIERVVFEMLQEAGTESSAKVVATGGFLRSMPEVEFERDLLELVDAIEPSLTLVGIHEIMKEQKENYHVR